MHSVLGELHAVKRVGGVRGATPDYVAWINVLHRGALGIVLAEVLVNFGLQELADCGELLVAACVNLGALSQQLFSSSLGHDHNGEALLLDALF